MSGRSWRTDIPPLGDSMIHASHFLCMHFWVRALVFNHLYLLPLWIGFSKVSYGYVDVFHVNYAITVDVTIRHVAGVTYLAHEV